MAKKFFDIIPPKEAKKEIKLPKPKRIFFKGLILCLFFLASLSVFAFLFFSKIKIEIWPEKEISDLKTEVIIDPELKEADLAFWLENKTIPGKIFQDEKYASQEFPASGKTLKEEKARGKIRVYNSYSTAPRTFKPSRFVSAEGKLFWSLDKIVIPGGRYEKGKLVPGEVDVEVVAAEPGEDYNIGPSTFALPALAGTPLYTAIYGKSFSAMTNGFKGEVPQVTKDDLEKAQVSLIEKLKKESKDFLKTSLPNDFILLEETVTEEIIEKSSSVEALAQAESFNYKVGVKSRGLGFKKSDMEKFVEAIVLLTVSEDKKLQEGTLEISYSTGSFDSKTSKATLNVEVKAKIFKDINLSDLKKALFGKSKKESKIFLENLPQVTRIEIRYWPFWQRKAPENIEKVEIRIRLD